MSNVSILFQPLASCNAIIRRHVQIQDIPTCLLGTIPIHIHNDNAVTRTNYKTWCSGNNPLIGRLATAFLAGWCEVQCCHRSIVFPSTMGSSTKNPGGTVLKGQRHLRLADAWREDRPSHFGTR